MIGAVHFDMTVRTILGNDKTHLPWIGSIEIVKGADVRSAAAGGFGSMTLLAQLGARSVQQGHMVGTVYAVAQRAVLAGRIVLPQERAALVSMAGVAVLVDAVLLQRCRSGGAVGVVAIAAYHLVFPNRMGVRTVCRGPNILVAFIANL